LISVVDRTHSLIFALIGDVRVLYDAAIDSWLLAFRPFVHSSVGELHAGISGDGILASLVSLA
jgi:hypothetical protein